MGLRLSLDSSESESAGPCPPSRHGQSYYHHHHSPHDNHSASSSSHYPSSNSAARSGGRASVDHVTPSHRSSHRPPGDTVYSQSHTSELETISIEELMRELEQGGSSNSDDAYLLRMLNARRRAARNAVNRRRRGEHRSSASVSLGATGSGSNGRRTDGSGPNADTSTTAAATSGRSRRSHESSNDGVLDSSEDSDLENGEVLNNLRLSTLMLRHFQLDGTDESGRRRRTSAPPQAENELIRVLRLSAARASYNVDRLDQNKGECTICLEDLAEGHVIARLPCLCIYHKKCIDSWFKRRPVCPEHPGD